MKFLLRSIIASVVFVEGLFIVNAQSEGGLKNSFVSIGDLINSLIENVLAGTGTLLMTVGVIVFFIGLIQYLWGAREGDAEKIKKGNKFMIWSLVALFVMFSVYGIVKLAQSILLKGGDFKTIEIPTLDFKGSSKRSSGGEGSGSCSAGSRCATYGGGAGTCNSSGVCIPDTNAGSNQNQSSCSMGSACSTYDSFGSVVSGRCDPMGICRIVQSSQTQSSGSRTSSAPAGSSFSSGMQNAVFRPSSSNNTYNTGSQNTGSTGGAQTYASCSDITSRTECLNNECSWDDYYGSGCSSSSYQPTTAQTNTTQSTGGTCASRLNEPDCTYDGQCSWGESGEPGVFVCY